MKKLVLLCVACLPFQTFAEVIHYSRCEINEGKTIDDVQAWVEDWRALVKKKNIDYKVRLLIPHAANEVGANEFFIEGGSPTLQSYAQAWEWWYTDPDAAASSDQANAASTCDSGTVYRTTD